MIRTNAIGHAVDDLSDARTRGADLNDPEFAAIKLDNGDVIRCVETSPGHWEAWSDSGASFPL